MDTPGHHVIGDLQRGNSGELRHPCDDTQTLDRFYRKVRPFGFWGRTASRCGVTRRESLKALGARLFAVAVTALSVYTLLIGVGRLLFPQPDGSPMLAWICVVIGLVLMPVWMYLAFSRYFDDQHEEEAPELQAERPDMAG